MRNNRKLSAHRVVERHSDQENLVGDDCSREYRKNVAQALGEKCCAGDVGEVDGEAHRRTSRACITHPAVGELDAAAARFDHGPDQQVADEKPRQKLEPSRGCKGDLPAEQRLTREDQRSREPYPRCVAQFFHCFFFFHCVSFHFHFFLFCFLLALLFIYCFFTRFFTFGHVKGNGRNGRSRHRPTNQKFGVCKVNVATLKVAIERSFDREVWCRLPFIVNPTN